MKSISLKRKQLAVLISTLLVSGAASALEQSKIYINESHTDTEKLEFIATTKDVTLGTDGSISAPIVTIKAGTSVMFDGGQLTKANKVDIEANRLWLGKTASIDVDGGVITLNGKPEKKDPEIQITGKSFIHAKTLLTKGYIKVETGGSLNLVNLGQSKQNRFSDFVKQNDAGKVSITDKAYLGSFTNNTKNTTNEVDAELGDVYLASSMKTTSSSQTSAKNITANEWVAVQDSSSLKVSGDIKANANVTVSGTILDVGGTINSKNLEAQNESTLKARNVKTNVLFKIGKDTKAVTISEVAEIGNSFENSGIHTTIGSLKGLDDKPLNKFTNDGTLVLESGVLVTNKFINKGSIRKEAAGENYLEILKVLGTGSEDFYNTDANLTVNNLSVASHIRNTKGSSLIINNLQQVKDIYNIDGSSIKIGGNVEAQRIQNKGNGAYFEVGGTLKLTGAGYAESDLGEDTILKANSIVIDPQGMYAFTNYDQEAAKIVATTITVAAGTTSDNHFISNVGVDLVNLKTLNITGDIKTQLCNGLTAETVNIATTSSENHFQTKKDFDATNVNVSGISHFETYLESNNGSSVSVDIDNLTIKENSQILFSKADSREEGTNYEHKVNIGKVTLKEGAVFGNLASYQTNNNDKTYYHDGINNLTVGDIVANGATIVNGDTGTIVISSLNGSNNEISVADTRADQIEIKANKSENLVLTTSKPGFADTVPGNNPGSALQELADTVNINTDESAAGTKGMTVKIGAGNVLGELTATTDTKGNIVSFTEAVNETNQVLHTTANLPVLAWRAELNDLHKRLGDVRLTPQKSGAWVRYNGGEMKWSDGDLKNNFDMIQVGIDTTPIDNEFRFGTAFSYTKGDTKMTGGSADLDTYSLAAYGSWVSQNGLYVDVIGRMANLKTDVTAVNAAGLTAYNGKFDNVALSLSTELGWRFNVTDMLFVEPQVEATYSYVNEESFKYEDRTYRMSAQDSAIVRAGFLAGLQCPNDKGNVYVRASVVHDFLGENELKVSNGTNSRTIENDFGGTWFEYGVGANFTIGNNTLVYADFERTSGGEIKQPWRVNLGLRYAF